VLTRLPDALFLIIGDGELASDLREQAQRLGVDRSVRFMGPRSDIEELLAVMDIFVSSSLWEGLPTVILEAMAANTPVVATRVSGNVELIRPGETGFLAPPDDPEALAEAMLAALLDPEESKRMSENARRHVQANFSIEEVANQHIELYQQLMARR
jgi:glycosyltransferase involved in cell wall biosynthesis